MDNKDLTKADEAVQLALKLKAELRQKKEAEKQGAVEIEKEKVQGLRKKISDLQQALKDLNEKKNQLEDQLPSVRNKIKNLSTKMIEAVQTLVGKKDAHKSINPDELKEGKQLLRDNKQAIIKDPKALIATERKNESAIKEEIEQIKISIQDTQNQIDELTAQTPEFINEKILKTHKVGSIDFYRYSDRKEEIDFSPYISKDTVKLEEQYGPTVRKTISDKYLEQVQQHFDEERAMKISPTWQPALDKAKELPNKVSEARQAIQVFKNKLIEVQQKVTSIFEEKPFLKKALNHYGLNLEREGLLLDTIRGSEESKIKNWEDDFSNFSSRNIASNPRMYNPSLVIEVLNKNSEFLDALVDKFNSITNENEAESFFERRSVDPNGFAGFKDKFDLPYSSRDKVRYQYNIFNKDDAEFIKKYDGVEGAQTALNQLEKGITDKQHLAEKIVTDSVEVAFLNALANLTFNKDVTKIGYELEGKENRIKTIEKVKTDVIQMKAKLGDSLTKILTRKDGSLIYKAQKELADALDKEAKELEEKSKAAQEAYNNKKDTKAGLWTKQTTHDAAIAGLKTIYDDAEKLAQAKRKEAKDAGDYNKLYFSGLTKIFEDLGDSSWNRKYENENSFYKMYPQLKNDEVTPNEILGSLIKWLDHMKTENQQNEKELAIFKKHQALLDEVEGLKKKYIELSNPPKEK